MKLTVVELKRFEAANGSGMKMVSVILESEPVEIIDPVTNWFDISQRKIAKSFKEAAFDVFFKGAEVGTELEGYGIYTRHSFVPDQSEAAEAAKGTKKVQNYSFSKNSKKLYLSDGKPFFSKQFLVKDGQPDAHDVVLPNITSTPVLEGMLEGRRPSIDELKAAGIELDPATVAKLNAPYEVAATAGEVRAGEANTLQTA